MQLSEAKLCRNLLTARRNEALDITVNSFAKLYFNLQFDFVVVIGS